MPKTSDPTKVAWVTGASSGLGRGIARRLAETGYSVAASARSADELAALAAEIPGRIRPFVLDVTDAAACESVARNIEATLGPIALAIFNAGSYFPTTAASFSVENFRRTVDLNLMGTVNCMGAIVPGMVERRSGHIAVMASVAGFVGLPTAASYGATKAALNNMMTAFKPDFDQYGVTLTVINPGFVKTPLTSKNEFPMPFLMELGDAVDEIVKGLEQRRFEIAFPAPMVLGTRAMAALPKWLLFAITRRMLPKNP